MTIRRLLLATILLSSLPGTRGFGLGQVRPIPPDSRDSTHHGGSGTINLAGTWQGTVQLDSVWGLQEQATSTSVRATLRFQPVGDASPTTMSSRSVHAGTFEIDFARFGFRLSTPDALGWSVGADSVRAVLNPAVDHGTVELRGVLRGETITGTWRYVSDPGGAIGRFSLRRASTPRSDSQIDTTRRFDDSGGRALSNLTVRLRARPPVSSGEAAGRSYIPQLTLMIMGPPATGPV
jgi:hypothetical protein